MKKLSAILGGLILMVLMHGTVSAQTKITLGHTGVADYLASMVAQEQGFFKKRGLDVTFQQVAGGALVPGLQGGSLQIATLPPTNMLLAIDGGLDLVVIAGTSATTKDDRNMGLLVGAASGISGPKGLVGKKVGVPSIGGSLYVLARKWIADQGVDVEKVKFVEVNFPQIGDMLRGGTIDAGVSADPFLQRIVKSGTGSVLAYFAASLPEDTSGVFYGTTRKWADANPQALKAFKEAIEEGVRFVKANPDAARADLAKYLKLPAPVLATIPTPRLKAEVTPPQLQFWIDTLYDMRMINKKPDAASLIK